jgi:hypothetical protein
VRNGNEIHSTERTLRDMALSVRDDFSLNVAHSPSSLNVLRASHAHLATSRI